MTTIPIFSEEQQRLSQVAGGAPREPEELAQKTQSIWDQIFHVASAVCTTIIPIIRSCIGAVVRDVFFFPLKCSLIANRQEMRKQLEAEEAYCRRFWDLTEPLDPNFGAQALIREKFAPPVDRTFNIELPGGKVAEITCRIMQTRAEGEKYYNFIQVPGALGTITNTVGNIYPYLAAFLNSAKEDTPARVIIVSENNLNFKPASLDEAGLALLETLKVLRREFGDIDQLVAHSIATIFFANALKQVDDPKILPKHIHLDRGPTSIWEASKKYFCGFGRAIYFLAQFGKWASDVEQDIVDFCVKWEERPTILITGVEPDHHFSGSANLCSGKKIKEIQSIQTLVFAPPRQIISEFGTHNMRADMLNPRYLAEESTFMLPLENLSEAILRHSLPVDDEEQWVLS